MRKPTCLSATLGTLLILATASSLATEPAESKTQPDTEPLPGLSELLAEESLPAEEATSVKVIVQKKQTIEEYRQRGELILIKVIPNDGIPYFIDPLERQKNHGSGRDLINAGVKPVRWVLKEF